MADQTPTTNLSSVPPHKPWDDGDLLQAVAKWHLARAELKAEYASRDLQKAADGHYNGKDRVLELCEKLRKVEDDLFECPAMTLRGIRALLAIAAEIEAYRQIDRDAFFGGGPVLRILAETMSSIDGLENRHYYGTA